MRNIFILLIFLPLIWFTNRLRLRGLELMWKTTLLKNLLTGTLRIILFKHHGALKPSLDLSLFLWLVIVFKFYIIVLGFLPFLVFFFIYLFYILFYFIL